MADFDNLDNDDVRRRIQERLNSSDADKDDGFFPDDHTLDAHEKKSKKIPNFPPVTESTPVTPQEPLVEPSQGIPQQPTTPHQPTQHTPPEGFTQPPHQSSPTQDKESPNVTLKEDPIKTVDEKRINPDKINEEYISLLNVDMRELEKLTENYPKLEAANNNTTRAWVTAYLSGLQNLLKGAVFTDAVERKASDWKQKVEEGGEELGPGRPRFASTGSNVISGDRALMKASSILGLGTVVQIPLWHTGIWVTIKAPSDASLLELERRIANEKISLGRYTSGMIFSNTSIYTVSYVVNFVINHITDASVKNISQEALKNRIKITDIPTLVWGLACAIYPNGYKYARPCTTDPNKCQHVVNGDIAISKLFWTDNSALSNYQRKLMTRRNEKFTDEELTRYEEEHVRGGSFSFNLHEDFKVKLRVPNITQYEEAGFNWVDGIVRLLEDSLGVSLKGKERDDYIIDQGRLSTLRQFSHWVESIEAGGDSIIDQETIEVLLATLSSEETISKVFFEKVGKYIDDSTLSLIALPKYRCPACGGEQKADINQTRHPHLLPIDVVRVFFTLLDQHIYKALSSRTL